jgi:hypothetical protein
MTPRYGPTPMPPLPDNATAAIGIVTARGGVWIRTWTERAVVAEPAPVERG